MATLLMVMKSQEVDVRNGRNVATQNEGMESQVSNGPERGKACVNINFDLVRCCDEWGRRRWTIILVPIFSHSKIYMAVTV